MIVIRYWNALNAIVEAPGFEAPPDLEKSLHSLLEKLVAHSLKQISSAEDKKLFDLAWAKSIAQRFGITTPRNDKRDPFLREMLVKLHLEGRQAEFWGMVREKREAQEIIAQEESRKRENLGKLEELVKHSLKQISSAEDKKLFDLAWAKSIAQRFAVAAARNAKRDSLLKEILLKAHLEGKQAEFWGTVQEKREAQEIIAQEESKKRENLRRMYSDLCSDRSDIHLIEAKLKSYFPDDEKFESSLDTFRKQFAIRARKTKKREIWLRKIAEELYSSHTAGAGLEG